MVTDLVVIGASDQGECTVDIVRATGRDRVVGFVDDHAEPGTERLGVPVLGGVPDLADLQAHHGFEAAVVAVGDNAIRAQLAAAVRAVTSLPFATLVHPSAVIGAGARVGAGTVLMARAVVNTGATLGEHVLLCVGSSVDHHAVVADFASFAPGAVTGGRVRIGSHVAIGIGASVIHGVEVGPHTVVGAGAAVVTDLPSHAVAVGVPARVARTRTEGERYL